MTFMSAKDTNDSNIMPTGAGRRPGVAGVFNGGRGFSVPNSEGRQAAGDYEYQQELIDNLMGRKAGNMTPYLFYTPLDRNGRYDPNVDRGINAWSNVVNGEGYSFSGSDAEVIGKALKGEIKTAEGKTLMDLMPANSRIVEYGPGETNAVMTKTHPFISALVQSDDKDVTGYVGIDKSEMFAMDGAQGITRIFDRTSVAIVGDFMKEPEYAVPEASGTNVVLIWGGPFQNAPEDTMSEVGQGLSPIDYMVRYFTIMNNTFGFDSRFVMTVDQNRNSKSYKPTPHFENFTLGGLHRAHFDGAILNENYDVNKFWEMQERKRRYGLRITEDDRLEFLGDGDFSQDIGLSDEEIVEQGYLPNATFSLNAKPKCTHKLRLRLKNGFEGAVQVEAESSGRPQVFSHKMHVDVVAWAARQGGYETEVIPVQDPANPLRDNKVILYGRSKSKGMNGSVVRPSFFGS